MKLSAELAALSERLLTWDQTRIRARVAQGHDCSVYIGRQRRVQAALSVDVDEWTEENRMLMMTLLEATRNAIVEVKEAGLGPLQHRPLWVLTPHEIDLYVQLAKMIGVLDRFKEVYPMLWRES